MQNDLSVIFPSPKSLHQSVYDILGIYQHAIQSLLETEDWNCSVHLKYFLKNSHDKTERAFRNEMKE